jgi:hypothetical protein
VLISQKDDPVLAVWQYGLGRVVAWTSDALGLWTANWLQWSDAARWWANLVTWTLPTPDSSLNVNATIVGGTGHLTVDLPPGTPIGANNQQMQVKIIAPDLSKAAVTLQPTAPQRWEGTFPTLQVGVYLLQVTWQGGNKQLGTTTGVVVPYSPEYHTMRTDLRFLTLLAHAGGGSLLTPTETAAAFANNLAPVSAAIPITFWLLTIAALLLPIDIAARRLASLEFLVLAYQWLLSRFRPRLATQAASSQESAINASALGAVRAKRQQRHGNTTTAGSPFVNKDTKKVARTPITKSQAASTKPASSTTQPTEPKSQAAEPEVSVASKLLEAKRNRAKKA